MDLERLFADESSKKKSMRQEKRIAKEVGGKPTAGSGSLPNPQFKADVVQKKLRLRIEAKQTEGDGIRIEGEWIDKLLKQRYPDEIPVLNIQIKQHDWYMVRKEEFEILLEAIEAFRQL